MEVVIKLGGVCVCIHHEGSAVVNPWPLVSSEVQGEIRWHFYFTKNLDHVQCLSRGKNGLGSNGCFIG